VVKPNQFIPLAETTGLIRQLTRRVLSLSLAQAAEWKERGLGLPLAVNLSAHSLVDADFPRDVRDMIGEAGLEPSDLELEITESSIMRDPNRALDILTRLHDMGVGLSVDDFGTGYSSLAYLRRLPLQTLKIDRAFVMNMETNPNDEVIVRSTIEMARNLGLKVVAEGVESLTTWYRLASFGCDQAQGYFLTRPMPGAALATWLGSWAPPAAEPHAPVLSR
jgi:EAL domain-containing protein (putative c-di-GMP-specific phosphodiesterase class I)